MIPPMKNFIDTKMNLIYGDFKRGVYEKRCLCSLKEFGFLGTQLPNYKDEDMQEYYLLRYLPAYLAEYYLIYNKIFSKNFLNSYSVLSLGCGCGVDLWGLHFAKLKRKLNCITDYTGIDAVKWKYSEFDNMNGRFKNIDVLDMEKLEGDYNTIIFPKSISEFDEVAFQHLKDIISRKKFKSKRIILVASVRKSRIDNDIERIDKIADLFVKNHGYSIVDLVAKKARDSDPYLQDVTENEIRYPDDLKEYITHLYEKCNQAKANGRNCSPFCKKILEHSPILRISQLAYRVIYLERKY